MLQRDDVVGDLAEVVGAAIDVGAGLSREQLPERRLGALDAAGEYGFAAHEGADQEVRVRQSTSLASKPANGAVRIGEGPDQSRRVVQRRRERVRYVGRVACGYTDDPPVLTSALSQPTHLPLTIIAARVVFGKG